MVGIATCLAAQIAKGLYVIAVQENALLGAKKGGEEINAIEVSLHTCIFTCSKTSFCNVRGGGGVYMYIFKIRFIISKFCRSSDHSLT